MQSSSRYLLFTLGGGVVGFALFLIMQSLIAMSGSGDDKIRTHRIPDFIRIDNDSALQTKERKLPQKEDPLEPPPDMDLDLPDVADASGSQVAIAAPSLDTAVDLGGGPVLGAAAADTDIVPLVRVEPLYPRIALEQGIQGMVRVEFTISPLGKVINPRVITADPPKIFNGAVLRAVRKWKYNPKVENGTAVERKGVIVTLRFNIRGKDK